MRVPVRSSGALVTLMISMNSPSGIMSSPGGSAMMVAIFSAPGGTRAVTPALRSTEAGKPVSGVPVPVTNAFTVRVALVTAGGAAGGAAPPTLLAPGATVVVVTAVHPNADPAAGAGTDTS